MSMENVYDEKEHPVGQFDINDVVFQQSDDGSNVTVYRTRKGTWIFKWFNSNTYYWDSELHAVELMNRYRIECPDRFLNRDTTL